MSDRGRSGSTVGRRGVLTAVFFVLIVVGAAVGTGLSSVGSARVGSTPATVGGNVPPNSVAPTAASVLSEVHRLVAAGHSPVAKKLATVPDSTWRHMVLAELTPSMLSPSVDLGKIELTGGIGAGLGIVVGFAVCAAVTLGACILALAAVGAVAAILGYVITSYGNNVNDGIVLFSRSLWQAYSDGVNAIETGVGNTLNAINLTAVAMEYAGASAALNQLGNTSFNPYLDLNDSGIPAQFATVPMAMEISEGGYTEANINLWQSVMGASGGYGSSGEACPLYFTSTGFSEDIIPGAGVFPADLSGTGSDAQCFTGLTVNNLWHGDLIPLSHYATGSNLWIAHGSKVAYKTASATSVVTLRPLDPHGLWFNLSLTSKVMTNFTGPTSIYHLTATNSVTSVGFSSAFPVDAASAAIGTAVPDLWGNWTDNPSVLGNAAGFMRTVVAAGCAQLTCPTFTLFGSSSATGVYQYLQTVEQATTNTAGIYWTVLRNLGYTDVSQVPKNCVIPPPSAAFSGFTAGELASTSPDTLARMYYAWLADLAFTFNASSAITILNICGKHLSAPTPYPWLNVTTNASGDVFIPNATANLTVYTHSHGVQYFNDTASWNVTGAQLYIVPSLNGINLTVNTSWLAPRKNPVLIFYDLNPGTNHSVLNLINFATGNSSNLSGSTYPNQRINGLSGIAVHLTSCVINGSFATVCPWYHSTINDKGAKFPCSGGVGINCGNSTGALVTTACGLGIPYVGIYIGQIASAVGFGLIGCLVAYAVVVIVVIIFLVVIAYIVAAVVRRD